MEHVHIGRNSIFRKTRMMTDYSSLFKLLIAQVIVDLFTFTTSSQVMLLLIL